METATVHHRTPSTVRMLVDTCSTAHRAPDGGVKFRAGLVVSVDEEPGGLDGVTARRWLRNAICEPYEGGVPGEVVTAEERVADVAALEAEMERLARLRDRAVAIAQGRELGVVRTPPVADDGAGRPIGAQPYAPEEDPLAVYGLADQQLEALKGAGFVRPDIIDNATDEELLEVVGVGERTVARLRGRRD